MRISTRCYAITGLGFTPPWGVNAGFIVGDAKTLIVDTGPTYLAARTVYGYALAARPGNEMIALNTEMHVDHMMGNSLFQDMSVPIWGHERCERSSDALEANAADFNATIPDPVRRERNEASAFFWKSRIVNPVNKISKKTLFDLGGVEAVVLPAAGHTPANLLVHLQAEGVLFTGDTVVADYLPNLESGGPEEWKQWLAALELVRGLTPSILVPGHGRVLEGIEIVREINRVEEFVREALKGK
jgi:glyoxylase-like metal-dependent hydrolase (beta-lactamase superfamily II)